MNSLIYKMEQNRQKLSETICWVHHSKDEGDIAADIFFNYVDRLVRTCADDTISKKQGMRREKANVMTLLTTIPQHW